MMLSRTSSNARCLAITLTVFFMASPAQTAFAQDSEWGTLTGRFAFYGEVPKVEKHDIVRDVDYCGVHGLKDESLIINKYNRGIANIVVWLYSKKPVPVHPDLKPKPEPVVLDNRDCAFRPHVFRIRTRQTLKAINSDLIPHNVACYAVRNEPFNLNITAKAPAERSFVKPELKPLRIDCSSHSWMKAYAVVTDHPYSAITDKDGRFKIEKLPAGEWEFRFWHERLGYLPKLDGNSVRELKRGGTKLLISKTKFDLGEMALRSKLFEPEP